MNTVPIDIALGALPFEERAAHRATRWAIQDDLAVLTCGPEDLVVHKVFAGRDQDWLDVAGVIERNGDALDRQLIRSELAFTPRYRRIRERHRELPQRRPAPHRRTDLPPPLTRPARPGAGHCAKLRPPRSRARRTHSFRIAPLCRGRLRQAQGSWSRRTGSPACMHTCIRTSCIPRYAHYNCCRFSARSSRCPSSHLRSVRERFHLRCRAGP